MDTSSPAAAVAVRYLCANHHSDHDSICTFRATNKQAFEAPFVSVLQLVCVSYNLKRLFTPKNLAAAA